MADLGDKRNHSTPSPNYKLLHTEITPAKGREASYLHKHRSNDIPMNAIRSWIAPKRRSSSSVNMARSIFIYTNIAPRRTAFVRRSNMACWQIYTPRFLEEILNQSPGRGACSSSRTSARCPLNNFRID
ncbi:hypothetical protein Trydic_g10905 [Trypoxylus dichotomus]